MDNKGNFAELEPQEILERAANILKQQNPELSLLENLGFLKQDLEVYRYKKERDNRKVEKTELYVQVSPQGRISFANLKDHSKVHWEEHEDLEFFIGKHHVRLDRLKGELMDKIRTHYISAIRELCEGFHADLEKNKEFAFPRVSVTTQTSEDEIFKKYRFLKEFVNISIGKPNEFVLL